MIKVLFFAGIAEKINKQQIEVNLNEITISQLREYLTQQFSDVEEELSQAMIAVNEEFAEEQKLLASGDTVALIPPVSGG